MAMFSKGIQQMQMQCCMSNEQRQCQWQWIAGNAWEYMGLHADWTNERRLTYVLWLSVSLSFARNLKRWVKVPGQLLAESVGPLINIGPFMAMRFCFHFIGHIHVLFGARGLGEETNPIFIDWICFLRVTYGPFEWKRSHQPIIVIAQSYRWWQ